MNIREKEIIEKFRSEDPSIRERQVHDVFYGKREDTKALREAVMKVVRFCFSDKTYRDRTKDIYCILIPLIWEKFMKASDSTIQGIDNLPGYFYTVARNCANSERIYIDESLGIIKSSTPLGPEHDDKTDEEDDIAGIMDALIENKPKFEGMRQTEIAKVLLDEYISQIPRREYRDILYAIDLKGWSHEKIVKEYGYDPQIIDLYHRYAKLALTRIALPDIKRNCSTFFRKYSKVLSPQEKEILDNFFTDNGAYHEKDISAIYLKLVKRVRKQRNEEKKEIKKENERIQRIINK